MKQLIEMTELVEMVRAQGFRCDGPGFEDEQTMVVSSFESVPGTYGHPKCCAQYMKSTGWLTVSGRPAVKIGGAL